MAYLVTTELGHSPNSAVYNQFCTRRYSLSSVPVASESVKRRFHMRCAARCVESGSTHSNSLAVARGRKWLLLKWPVVGVSIFCITVSACERVPAINVARHTTRNVERRSGPIYTHEDIVR